MPPRKKKREISASLTSNILPKKAKQNDENVAAVPANPQQQVAQQIVINDHVQQPLPQPVLQEPDQPVFDLQYDLEELDDAPEDDILLKVLQEVEQENQVQVPQGNASVSAPPKNDAIVPAPLLPVPVNQLQHSNATMNIQNVQNNNPGKFTPAMYFPHSNVTINYNFGK